MPQTMHEKFLHMTETPIRELIPELAAPTILSMLVTSFYNMADTFFVGRINTQATAAVGVVFSFMAVLQACGFFFGHGSGNYISRRLGAEDAESASRMAANGFFLSLFTGAVITASGLLFLEPLSLLLGSTPTILPYTCSYLRIILLGSPFIMSSFVMNNQLRYQGSASYAMVGIVVGAVLNIALDPLLIFTLHMGIAGAAAATVISQFVSFCILLKMCASGSNLRLSARNFSLRAEDFAEILRGGFPSLCRQGLASVATVALNQSAGAFGDAAIAGMSVVGRVTMFANSVLIGWGQGFQPVCGFNYGAKKYSRVQEAFWFCAKTAVVVLLVIAAAGWALAPQIVALFRDDPEVISVAAAALRWQCLTIPLGAWTVLTNMALQSIGKSVSASVTAASRQGLFFLPAIWLLPRFLGLSGILLSQPAADLCSFLLALPLMLTALREMQQAA